MEVKLKAKELVDKFQNIIIDTYSGQFENAKQCALIAVDEILLLYKKEWNIDNQYWKEVKKEIEKYEPNRTIRIRIY
jgi:hypothetical protein